MQTPTQYREQVLAAQPAHTWASAVAQLLATSAEGDAARPVTFAKHIAKQLPPAGEGDALWTSESESTSGKSVAQQHVVLFREPARVLASWHRALPDSVASVAAAQHEAAFDALERVLPHAAAVVDNEWLLREPERVLRALCARLELPFDARMLAWPAGPKPELYGVWANVWYADTLKSTGFEPHRRREPAPVFDEGSVLDQACALSQPVYQKLRQRALPPAVKIPDPRNEHIKIWCNGLRERHEARVSVFDSAVQNGDAVWEGLRVYRGMRIGFLHEHLDRLFDSAHTLMYQHVPTRGEIVRAIVATLEANGMEEDTHIRLTLTRGEKVTSGNYFFFKKKKKKKKKKRKKIF